MAIANRLRSLSLGPWFGVILAGSVAEGRPDVSFPVCEAVVDVTKAPYHAKGDGQTDDTQALQQAMTDAMGHHKVIYLPEGTYLVSKTLRWSKRDSKGGEAWGFNTLQGQDVSKSVIRLKDGTFTDANDARPILWCGGFGSADWFHNYIQSLTFDVGRGNPGAIGLQFYSNNTGAIRNTAVVSGDGQGAIGLDLAPADMNGPLLVQDIRVEGFAIGIRTGGSVNSQTFERVRLANQSKVGLANLGQSIAIRGLSSRNEVPALRSESFGALIDARLEGFGNATRFAAIELGQADFYARNVVTSGYQKAISTQRTGGTDTPGPIVNESTQGKATEPFPTLGKIPHLEVRETPDVPLDNPARWGVVDAFGADPTGQRDSSEAIQKAIDSGASTIFFPGAYKVDRPVKVRGQARRLLGVGQWVDYWKQTHPDFIVEEGESPVVVIEHFAPINGGVAIETDRTVVFRSVEVRQITGSGHGDLYLEDVSTDNLRINPRQRVWARQLNVENEGPHITNDGGSLWILGYKTERGGTLLKTTGKGRSEVLGTFSYTTTAGSLAPMFVTEDASVFAFFNEVCYSGDPFKILIRETRKGVTKTVGRGEGGTSPYIARPATD